MWRCGSWRRRPFRIWPRHARTHGRCERHVAESWMGVAISDRFYGGCLSLGMPGSGTLPLGTVLRQLPLRPEGTGPSIAVESLLTAVSSQALVYQMPSNTTAGITEVRDLPDAPPPPPCRMNSAAGLTNFPSPSVARQHLARGVCSELAAPYNTNLECAGLLAPLVDFLAGIVSGRAAPQQVCPRPHDRLRASPGPSRLQVCQELGLCDAGFVSGVF
jgi:hypothetical protein